MAALLVLAQTMLPEGCGRPKAAPKDHLRAPFINALLVNVKQAIGELWEPPRLQRQGEVANKG